MKRSPDGLGPILSLDRRLAAPLHRQIYDGYRQAILDGRLRPGQRLPSTRSLAGDLRVSRITVVTAFEQLAAEGYIESRVGAGSVVSPALPASRSTPPSSPSSPSSRPGPRRVPRLPLDDHDDPPWLALTGAFRVAQPAIDEFPAELWARLVARHARRLTQIGRASC